MNQLMPFSFESSSIRVVTKQDGSWSVVAKDVALALGYARFDSNLLHLVPDEWKGTNPIRTPGGVQDLLCLTEPGLYYFLARSDKQKAIPFQKWIAGDVLPSIRKTGSYNLPETSQHQSPIELPCLESAMSIAREGAKLARAFGFKGSMIALSGNTLAKTVTGVDMLALMGATHLIADPRGMTYTPTELGAMCDPKLSAIKFNLLLEAAGLQTKEFGSWLPTDAADGKFEWLDTNKRHTDGTPVKQIKWFSSVLNDVAAPKIRATA